MTPYQNCKADIVQKTILGPNEHYTKPFHMDGPANRSHGFVLPILTLIGLPWKIWKKEKSIGILQAQTLRGEGTTTVRTLEKGALTSEAALLNTVAQAPVPTVPGTRNIYHRLEETILMSPTQAAIIPAQASRYFSKLTGTWEEFAEYFDGNREAGWKSITVYQQEKLEERSYLPPLALRVNLNLVTKENFSDSGLPTGKQLELLLRALEANKNRILSIILEGNEEAVNMYQKEIEKVIPAAFPSRFNVRCINPFNLHSKFGTSKLKGEILPECDTLLSSLPEINTLLKTSKKKQEKSEEARRMWSLYECLVSILEKDIPMEARHQLTYKEYTLAGLLEEKAAHEKSEEARRENYRENGYSCEPRPFEKEKVLEFIRQNGEATAHTFYRIAEQRDNTKREWSKDVFLGAKTNIPGFRKFEDLFPTKAQTFLPYTRNLFSEDTVEAEREFHRTVKDWARNATWDQKLSIEALKDGKAPNTDIQKLWEEYTSHLKRDLNAQAEVSAKEIKEYINICKAEIEPCSSITKVLYIYGEISQRPPVIYPPTVSRDMEKPPTTDEISLAVGKEHTPYLFQIRENHYTKEKYSILPILPQSYELYVEPSTLPSLPKSLQEKPMAEFMEELLDPSKKGEIRERISSLRAIPLNAQLKPNPDPLTELFLDIDERQIEIFNPVIGKPTGLKQNLLWRPVLTKQGIAWVNEALRTFGYELLTNAAVHNYVERKVRKSEKVLSPNYALTPYEMLAYFRNEERTAQNTVVNPDTGAPIWIEGKSYQITPSWDREQILVDNYSETEENIEPCEDTSPSPDLTIIGSTKSKIKNAERIERLNQISINFGFSTFQVQQEGKTIVKIKETVGRNNASVEKERIAEEIERCQIRVEDIEKNYAPEKEIARAPKDTPSKKAKLTPTIRRELLDLKKRCEILEAELESWAPTVDDFLEAFPPEPPPLATQVYEDELKAISKRIFKRFAPHMRSNTLDDGTSDCTLKNYQIRGSAIMALKRSCGNGSPPGAGKSIMAIMASWAMEHHYNLIVCPTMATNTWAKELEKVGLYHEVIGHRKSKDGLWKSSGTAYTDIREITARMHKRIRQNNRLGKVEPEYYIVSAEVLSLGGEGNLRFNPWHCDYPITKAAEEALGKIEIPPHWEITLKKVQPWKKGNFNDIQGIEEAGETNYYAKHIRIWSDRADNSHELNKHNLGKEFKSISFRRAIRECPKCGTEGEKWSDRGHCRNCNYSHSSMSRENTGWNLLESKFSAKKLQLKGKAISSRPKKDTEWKGDKTSNCQYPAYRLLRKHFGAKIIDEIHNFSSFTSQHGNALLQIKTKDTIVLSGTLCRTMITELEPTLCHIYEPNSGEFPYTPWGMELFQEQFSTFEIRNTTELKHAGGARTSKRKRTINRVPEASNLTKLRALMHGVIFSVSEKEMAAEWNLRPIQENIIPVDLQPENADIYAAWQQKIQDAYTACKTEHERTDMLRKSRSLLTSLAYACDGPEKLDAAIAWIRRGIADNKRMVVVGPSTRFYTLLQQELKAQGIPFMAVGSMPAEKRFEALNKFRDSKTPLLISRIRLINVNFNQLTCCQRILFTGIDPSPSAIRQMQMRLNRIGQTQEVECDFLVTRLPEVDTRRVIRTLNQGANISVNKLLDEQLGSTTKAEPAAEEAPPTKTRYPSYEERLFATILRREKAIQAVLHQADRQRDPQELYDLLQDRQTLNQILQDIATSAQSDLSILKEINSQKVTPVEPTQKIQVEIPIREPEVVTSAKPDKKQVNKKRPLQLHFTF